MTVTFFWIFGVIAMGSGLLCITRKSPVASALWLVVTLFALAAMYVLLDAQFIAVLQVLVYAGAIMVLFLFVIMLLNLGRPGPTDIKGPLGVGIAAVLGGTLLLQLRVLGNAAPPAAPRCPTACSSSPPSSARWCSPSAGSSMLLGPALAISAVLFTLGVAGVLLRRNAIVIFMCVELMLNAVNLTFIALAQRLGVGGQVFVFFVMAVAAAEAAVGLAIILAVYRHKPTVNLQDISLLKG